MMLAAAGAAPAAPFAGLTAAYILVTFALVVLIGLQAGYQYTLGAMLRELAETTRGIRWIGGKIAAVFEALDSRIQRAIGDGIEALDKTSARLWDSLAWLTRELGDALYEFGGDIHDAIYGVVNAEIPTQIRAGTAPIDTRLDGVNRRADARLRAEALARSRGIDELNRDLTREALARERGIDWLGTKLGELVLPRIRALDQAVSDVWGFTRRNLLSRIRSLEQALAAGAVGAIALAALTRHFPFWQCSNVKGFNRFLCRLPVGLLDDLLGLAIVGLVLTDVCRMSRLGIAAAKVAAPLLLEIVAVVDAATRCTSYPKPPALPLRTTALATPAAPLAL